MSAQKAQRRTILASLVKVKTPILRRRKLQALLRTAFPFPFSPTQRSNLLFLINDTSKPRQNRNTVLVMPPNSSRRVPANTRETRSTLNLEATTANAIVKKYENAAQSPLHKLAPELMGMILELVLVSDEPVTISKFGRHQMPCILQVASEIRANGLKIYYSKNDFRAIVTGKHTDGPLKWAVDIASANLRYIPTFTFDYRLTRLDYKMGPPLGKFDELRQMCDDARGGIVTSVYKFRDLKLELKKVRLHVDVVPRGVRNRASHRMRGLRFFLVTPISQLIVLVEAITMPASSSVATHPDQVAASIHQGNAMRSTHECWDLATI